MKYSEEFKAETISAYYDRTTNASVFLAGVDIPRSTFYGWLRKYNAGQEKKRKPKYTKGEYNNLQTRIANLESKIEILKTVNCTVHFYYICAVMDLYSRKIIGYEISKRNSTQLVKTTIRHAAESRAFSDDLIFHSDRGANFTAAATREYLHSLHIQQSFSRPGNPHDNAVMESFFSTLKREELYRIEYRSEREFKAAVGAYITFYNSKRPHRKLKNRTPDAWEAEYRCKTKESKDS